MGDVTAPKIILYTSYLCPWAHRVQIILHELGLSFETVHIDLDVPRTEEYLKINPRGLVPTLDYDGEIIMESGIISQFLADTYPSYILPSSTSKGGALHRARVAFFTDTYFSKVHNQFTGLSNAPLGAEQEAKALNFVNSIVKEIEPLLQDANPFFGGSEKLGFAEVLTGSFLLRLLSFPKHGMFPESILTLEEKAPKFWKWANAVVAEKSVNYIWDEEKVVKRSRAKADKARASALAARL